VLPATASGGPPSGTTINATVESGEPSTAGGLAQTVWYNWTGLASGAATQFWTSDEFIIDVFTGPSVSNLTLVGTSSNGSITLDDTAGTLYRIRVRPIANTGDFALRWFTPPAPGNDAFGAATPISGSDGGPQSGTTIGATIEPGEPATTGSLRRTVWYRWAGIYTGAFIDFVTHSPLDFVIDAYTGSWPNLILVGTSDSNGLLSFQQTAGLTYWIRVRPVSASADFTLSWYTIVNTPTFSPDPDTYVVNFPNDRVLVTVRSTTEDAWLAITTDGSTPSPSNGLQIAHNTTIVPMFEGITVLQAMAYLNPSPPGDQSTVQSGTYTVQVAYGPPCSELIFTPSGGNFPFPLPVTITCPAPADAVIAYTTDGTLPSRTHGIVIANGTTISLTGPCFLKAIAYRRGRADSPIHIDAYRSSVPVVAPTLSPSGGNFYNFPVLVTVSTTTQGAQMRYTLDGTPPTETYGTLIPGTTGTVSVPAAGTVLRVIAFAPNYRDSPIVQGKYLGAIAPPTHTPDTSQYDPVAQPTYNVTVDLTTPQPYQIMYTLDGTTPSRKNGTLIATPPAIVPITNGYRQLQSMAFDPTALTQMVDSAVKSSIYDWALPAT
jgi:hypothetical protein